MARPPEFGEQTEEVLVEFGFGADEIAELRRGVVVCDKSHAHSPNLGLRCHLDDKLTKNPGSQSAP